MDIFAGVICFGEFLGEKNQNIEIQRGGLDYDIISLGEKSIFVMGALEEGKTPGTLFQELEKVYGQILSHTLSFEPKQRLEILVDELQEGVYESAVFQGPHIQFDEIFNRFSENDSVICIRELGICDIFGNTLICVDFLY